MGRVPGGSDLARRFLASLAATLDVNATIKNLGMTEEAARAILRALAGEAAPPAAKGPCPPGRYEIRVDGASRGNPGEAGAGAVIRDPGGSVVRELRKYLGIATNNTAEYSALLMALAEAAAMGVTDVEVLADSELMVKQINGLYRVKSPDLKPLYDEAKRRIGSFKSFRIIHVYREENAAADRLANEAIERKAGL